MAKKKVQFESFPDGVCKLWQLDGGKRPVLRLSGVRYRERTVGERRNLTLSKPDTPFKCLFGFRKWTL